MLWQGRPAPRCYLFRHWRGQLACVVALTGFSFLLIHALKRDVRPIILILLLVSVFIFLAVGPVRLLLLRCRWENIFYAVTSQRFLILYGRKQQIGSYPLADLQSVKVSPYSDKLADIELIFADSRRIVFECLEEPATCLRVFPEVLIQHQVERDSVV